MRPSFPRRAFTLAAIILPAAVLGCGTEKMNETEGRGGTRVDNVAPETHQPDIGASNDLDKIKKETPGAGKSGADSSTPYGGGGAGAAPPVSPSPNAPASGDTNSGQTSGNKMGPGSDTSTEGARVNPNATGPGTGSPPK